MKIGFYDSGLGGLVILKAVAKELPMYDYYYYGDTANLPYGDKSEEEIYFLATTAMDYLFKEGCSLVIIACNSASADTARKIQNEYLPLRYPDRKVLGVIIPTIEEMVKVEKSALLLCTARTATSGKYEKELHKLKHKGTLKTVAVPELVPLIEKGNIIAAEEIASDTIETYGEGREVVVLGCTHYTKLKQELRKKFPNKKIISQDEVIPNKLKTYLLAHPEIESKLSRGSERKIHLTEHRPDYDKVLQQLLGGVMVEED
ncbi:glutamate racemase [Candidatus Nomurabacteria bacterium]|nr:glutamate racemase [Candidatus Kaiserbacteria bacterium]MCB9810440.1 glutamate racemase [Candidatus Nomurabacteria bacterium]MCB9818231.1 glutamate racemase [Candidatus Nomurabacteria bacterium]